MDYYKRLEVAELEGDILKGLVAKNLAKVEALHKKLAQAKLALCQMESRQLGYLAMFRFLLGYSLPDFTLARNHTKIQRN